MADTKLSALTELSTLSATDHLYVSPLVTGTRRDRRMTGANLALGVKTLIGASGELLLGKASVAAGAAQTMLAVQNDADADAHAIVLKSGSTGDYRCYINWHNYSGSQAWLMGRNAADSFILYGTATPAHRMVCETSGTTWISSVGTSPVIINGQNDNGSGTGGLVVKDGSTTKVTTHSFTSSQTLLTGSNGTVHTLLQNNNTDASSQNVRIAVRHYTKATSAFGILYGISDGAANSLAIGGGTGAVTAATVVNIYAAATVSTLTGTLMARVTTSGMRIESGVTANAVASSILDLVSTTKGFLPPRMTGTQRDAISAPAAGLVVYNTTTNKLNVYTTAWEQVTSA